MHAMLCYENVERSCRKVTHTLGKKEACGWMESNHHLDVGLSAELEGGGVREPNPRLLTPPGGDESPLFVCESFLFCFLNYYYKIVVCFASPGTTDSGAGGGREEAREGAPR